MQIFTTEEEVQVWMDGHERYEGRAALTWLMEHGNMPEQSVVLARAWLLNHPLQPDRRRPRNNTLPDRIAAWCRRPVQRRRASDRVARNFFLRPVVVVLLVVVLIVVLVSCLRRQTVVSPVDGGFVMHGPAVDGPFAPGFAGGYAG